MAIILVNLFQLVNDPFGNVDNLKKAEPIEQQQKKTM